MHVDCRVSISQATDMALISTLPIFVFRMRRENHRPTLPIFHGRVERLRLYSRHRQYFWYHNGRYDGGLPRVPHTAQGS